MMKPALGMAGEIVREMGGTKLFFFDFDGTVSEITEHPGEAVPVAGVAENLYKLASYPNCKVSVISGRKYEDIARFFDPDRIIVCGNHGAEAKGPGVQREEKISPEIQSALIGAAAAVNANFGMLPGFAMEYKKYGIALHYRNMKQKDSESLEEWIRMAMKNRKDGIRLRQGKKVFELLPESGFGKADAIIDIAESCGACGRLFFAGDDSTDTEAFNALGIKAIKVFVGEDPPFNADYFLAGPGETAVLIRELCGVMEAANG